MSKDDIKQLLLRGERITLECKKASTNVPDNVWDTYSAFANTYGGTIILGIYEDMTEKDLAKRFTILGVGDDGNHGNVWHEKSKKLQAELHSPGYI